MNYIVPLIVSTLCIVSLYSIAKVRDNVIAALLLLVSALCVGALAYLSMNILLTILVLVIYVGVVITFIVVVASAVESVEPMFDKKRVVASVVLGLSLGLMLGTFIKYPCVKYSSSSYSISSIITAMLNNVEFRTITILIIVLTVVMFLIVIQLCRRGITK
ncbi:MAG: hypothetical protein GXO10_00460 [Crenarchaeota archaeon]|nr:hypothetical protein [Thermoproteota archaeon]